MYNEHQRQKDIVHYLRIKGHIVINTDIMSGLAYFAHNDPKRYAFIAHHKAMGYIKGQPDLIVLTNTGNVVCIEVKDAKGKQTPEQKTFEEEVNRINIPYYVVRNLDEIADIL